MGDVFLKKKLWVPEHIYFMGNFFLLILKTFELLLFSSVSFCFLAKYEYAPLAKRLYRL